MDGKLARAGGCLKAPDNWSLPTICCIISAPGALITKLAPPLKCPRGRLKTGVRRVALVLSRRVKTVFSRKIFRKFLIFWGIFVKKTRTRGRLFNLGHFRGKIAIFSQKKRDFSLKHAMQRVFRGKSRIFCEKNQKFCVFDSACFVEDKRPRGRLISAPPIISALGAFFHPKNDQ